uniref:NADH dehydrogenase subunit 5 n=1 Tax=Schistosoma curassoni TaxID=6186 RepID=A0A183KS95_9TREM
MIIIIIISYIVFIMSIWILLHYTWMFSEFSDNC